MAGGGRDNGGSNGAAGRAIDEDVVVKAGAGRDIGGGED